MRDVSALIECFPVGGFALLPGKLSAAGESLQALADNVGARECDRAFGDESLAQRNLSRELARQRAPPKRARDNRDHRALLVAEPDLASACRGDLKRHADLIGREECGV